MTMNALELLSEPAREWFCRTFERPTSVQEETWPAIAAGKPVLVSAPTGTGKTLSAFLIFIDRLSKLAEKGCLKEELYVIYVSPLKSLAADIRENLRRPLDGIGRSEGQQEITVAVRTGDTLPRDRQRMVKHPPHILITTPESLYLMLTSKTGQGILKTARAIILDELHALIDTKRGAHLMLSVARLDALCGEPLQRIGLSATIEPLELAAAYLSPEPAVIVHPPMEKKIEIRVIGTPVPIGGRKDPVWEDLAASVYEQCLNYRSVIAFSEGRRYVEKLAYYVNQLAGEGFARVHHGSLSKDQRDEVERDLREGRLRLLCATSSMELGIDVGDIDKVLQIGCPRTISSTMQRLGRAGHNPNRVSAMDMYSRLASETVDCGITAQIAREGGLEHAKPPLSCLDVLAQHLVSMAVGDGYAVEDVMDILSRTYSFRDVTRDDVRSVLRMLAGDYEHDREIPVRPRVLYDRIHDRVTGDPYSRMLAVAAGGTIPDKGMYAARTEAGVKVGELDEEFVYESQLGDRFLLGAFAWKIVGMDKDSVIVTQSQAEGARLPFWKGELKGRPLESSLAYGRIMGKLGEAYEDGNLPDELEKLGLDQAACKDAEGYLKSQIEADGGLPDDHTIVAEHFRDRNGCDQLMVHALFGKRINAPLSLLIRQEARRICQAEIGCVDDDKGFLLYPFGNETLPEGLFKCLDPEHIRGTLEALLPETSIFGMTFRYNAGRALMMGMKHHGRQPLWMQRLRSAEMLTRLMGEKDHPLVRETRRECLEDMWDLDGLEQVVHAIRAGLIRVREITVDVPSPMSLPYQWQVEADQMYEYSPVTPGMRQAVYDELKAMDQLKPPTEELARQAERKKLPENEDQLHSLLMMEGDLLAGELDVPLDWLENLAARELALYIEPGLWIAAEQQKEYENALEGKDQEAGRHILRRLLYYRGGMDAEEIGSRYLFPEDFTSVLLDGLVKKGEIVLDSGIYYHSKLYDRARNSYIRNLRAESVTVPPENYAALAAAKSVHADSGEEQLKAVIAQYVNRAYPVKFWENILFTSRVRNYSEGLLDRLLAQGDYFWRMCGDGSLAFCRYEEIDWEAPLPETGGLLTGDEALLYRELSRRGASFLKFLTEIPKENSAQDVLLGLAEKGLVCADSFVPVRQWANREKVKKATARQRVNARVMALSAGRWDVVRPLKEKRLEELLWLFFEENPILCKETFRKAVSGYRAGMGAAESARLENPANPAAGGSGMDGWTWSEALKILRVWEYTGKARRGYFVKGLSGAQFIRKEDYEGITAALKAPVKQVIWLNATDPALMWGKALELPEERGFLAVPGTAVALYEGRIAAVMERQGKVLRIFEWETIAEVLEGFVRSFGRKQVFPELKRLIVKEYPGKAEEALQKAGFMREMKDYVLYR